MRFRTASRSSEGTFTSPGSADARASGSTKRMASFSSSSEGKSPRAAALAKSRPMLSPSVPLGRVPFRSATAEKNGVTTSENRGTASWTGLLLKLSNALAALGVSGNRLVINMCNNDPQLCPTPTTGMAPYCLASAGATRSNLLMTASQVCK